MDRRLVVSRRHQDRLLRRNADTQQRRRVQVREEDQDVVLMVIALEVIEKSGAPGSLLPQPLQLILT